MGKEIKIAFHPPVVNYLDQLIFTLYKKGYFGFIDSAINYIDKMVDFINKNIQNSPRKKAPAYFDIYGKNMYYITYQPNKQTTWYIFFVENDNRYLIKYITNNHVSGHLIDYYKQTTAFSRMHSIRQPADRTTRWRKQIHHL